MTALLPALTPSTIDERNSYWRKWMRSARREELYQSGYYTEPRVVGSGPVLALRGPRLRQLSLFDTGLAPEGGNVKI